MLHNMNQKTVIPTFKEWIERNGNNVMQLMYSVKLVVISTVHNGYVSIIAIRI